MQSECKRLQGLVLDLQSENQTIKEALEEKNKTPTTEVVDEMLQRAVPGRQRLVKELVNRANDATSTFVVQRANSVPSDSTDSAIPATALQQSLQETVRNCLLNLSLAIYFEIPGTKKS